MATHRITFPNAQGVELAGLLDLPDNPIAFALFAHCFTCGKDIKAAAHISRALQARGVAVLRFDFTGLGHSEGDFANSNFSSNITDLLAAADFLRRRHQAPALLIGHSLGGAAILAAAHHIPDARAVITIAAPAEADHILRQFQADLETICQQGEATVSLAGRPFTIRRQFIDDVAKHDQTGRISQLDKALLVFHSPRDTVVSIDQAQKIYEAAHHPKSFISLDTADHLLSQASDAEYVATCIVAWASRYLNATASETAPHPAPSIRGPAVAASSTIVVDPALPDDQVRVTELNHAFLRGVQAGPHTLLADEPRRVGGDDQGPSPYALLLSALGTCTSMTIRMYANHKGLALEDVQVTLQHRRTKQAATDSAGEQASPEEVLERYITLTGPLSQAQRQRLLEIADRCPIHKTLTGRLQITTHLQE
ncbi:MAG: bifunctional alpha/beta hydrolase/OsmC family protein [Lautropia sp.]|nr:bifunctional alpha/beta hydrolase/OsmC family protein [Lautropia sp.]